MADKQLFTVINYRIGTRRICNRAQVKRKLKQVGMVHIDLAVARLLNGEYIERGLFWFRLFRPTDFPATDHSEFPQFKVITP